MRPPERQPRMIPAGSSRRQDMKRRDHLSYAAEFIGLVVISGALALLSALLFAWVANGFSLA